MTTPPDTPAKTVAVVGAGISGLACAKVLHDAGAHVTVFEAADGVGGRVRTDGVGGFKLDRGFHVFLTAYPECRALLDYGRLDLHPFESGALVFKDGSFRRLADPLRAWKSPLKLLATARADIGTAADKLKVAKLRRASVSGTVDGAFAAPERTTLETLHALGFSNGMIGAFFKPFLGGVFLERDLSTSDRMLYFTFGMFAKGAAALPAGGIGAVPKQLADALPYGRVRLNARVTEAHRNGVTTANGERFDCDAVVLAVDGDAAAELGVTDAGADARPSPAPRWHGTTGVALTADHPPVREPVLMLNGDGPDAGPINSLHIPTQVSRSYGPGGRSLIVAQLLGVPDGDDAALYDAVKTQAKTWFGVQANGWEPLSVVRVPRALPAYVPPTVPPQDLPAVLPDGRHVCGDWRSDPSLNGAMRSGRRAAEAVLTANASPLA